MSSASPPFSVRATSVVKRRRNARTNEGKKEGRRMHRSNGAKRPFRVRNNAEKRVKTSLSSLPPSPSHSDMTNIFFRFPDFGSWFNLINYCPFRVNRAVTCAELERLSIYYLVEEIPSSADATLFSSLIAVDATRFAAAALRCQKNPRPFFSVIVLRRLGRSDDATFVFVTPKSLQFLILGQVVQGLEFNECMFGGEFHLTFPTQTRF